MSCQSVERTVQLPYRATLGMRSLPPAIRSKIAVAVCRSRLLVHLMKPQDISAEELKQAIRDAGLRATPARIATLQLLRGSATPMTHAEVAEHLAQYGVDKATAFRNLNDMTEANLLRRTELGDHVYRFEEVGPGEEMADSHPHFLCTVCGTVACLTDIQLTAGSRRASDRVGEVTEILLRGRCNECRS